MFLIKTIMKNLHKIFYKIQDKIARKGFSHEGNVKVYFCFIMLMVSFRHELNIYMHEQVYCTCLHINRSIMINSSTCENFARFHQCEKSCVLYHRIKLNKSYSASRGENKWVQIGSRTRANFEKVFAHFLCFIIISLKLI